MRAFQLLCLFLVVVASVSGAAGVVGDKDAAPAPKPAADGTVGTGTTAGTTTTGDRTSTTVGFCSGAHKDCEKYNKEACLSEKPLGCEWNEPTKDEPTKDAAPAPKPIADGTHPIDTKADLNAAPAPKPIADGTRPVDPTKPKSECVRIRPCN